MRAIKSLRRTNVLVIAAAGWRVVGWERDDTQPWEF